MTVLLLLALAAPVEGPVVWLRFKGARRARPEELNPLMGLSVAREYSQDLADGDVVRLMRTGLFKRVEIKPVAVRGGVGVLVELEERPVVEEIVFRNAGPVGREELLDEVRSRADSPLDELRALEDCTRLERLYRRKLFPFARVSYSTGPVPGSRDKVKLIFDISTGEKAPLKRIRLLGNDSIPDKMLIRLTTLRGVGRSLEGLERGEFSSAALDSDIETLERYYRSKGFLDAEVKPASVTVVRVSPRAYLEVVIEIEEGPLYTTRGIEAEGTSELPREKVMKAIVSPDELPDVFPARPSPYPLKDGEPFSFTAMQAAASRVHYLYGSEGRYMTQVTGRPRFVEGCRVDVTFNVKEGEPTKIRAVFARGNTKTQDKVLAREFRIKKGDDYDVRKISKTRQNLLALRYFSSVEHRIRPAGKDLVDVIFDVEETETGMLQMGFGLSSNESWSGQLMYEQMNFAWDRWPRSGADVPYAFMGGGQRLSASLMWGEFTERVRIHYSQPYIFGRPVALGLDYYSVEGAAGLDYYDQDVRGAGVSWTHRSELSPYKRRYAKIGLSLKREGVDIDVKTDLPPVLEDDGSWRLNKASLSLEYDSRNYAFRPSAGTHLSLGQEMAEGIHVETLEPTALAKTSAGLDFYWPLSPAEVRHPTVFNLHLRAGLAQPWGDATNVPIFERYRAGGIGTIRGFDYMSIGPWERDKKGNKVVLGGNFRWYGTAAFSFPFAGDDLRFVTFLDWGNVWNDHTGWSLDWDAQKKAVGFGIVLGPYYFPISLYWAWAIDPDPEDKTQVFSFNMATTLF